MTWYNMPQSETVKPEGDTWTDLKLLTQLLDTDNCSTSRHIQVTTSRINHQQNVNADRQSQFPTLITQRPTRAHNICENGCDSLF